MGIEQTQTKHTICPQKDGFAENLVDKRTGTLNGKKAVVIDPAGKNSKDFVAGNNISTEEVKSLEEVMEYCLSVMALVVIGFVAAIFITIALIAFTGAMLGVKGTAIAIGVTLLLASLYCLFHKNISSCTA
ncbi:MAG: hypothetical protein H0T62_00120 [Parachlamydiaceae bacterium]|nr:hypothetical protein [Parachlamydiaceae bacterium]